VPYIFGRQAYFHLSFVVWVYRICITPELTDGLAQNICHKIMNCMFVVRKLAKAMTHYDIQKKV